MSDTVACSACPRHCVLSEGMTGACLSRENKGGRIECKNYAWITSIALDPIEKKPFLHFHPGTRILSVGSFGCNLKCPFCQNHDISQVGQEVSGAEKLMPQELLELALSAESRDGSIGVAFTYNEPLAGFEYVRDSAILLKENGLCTAVVTNGCFEEEVLEMVLPYIDAFNIDLKGFSQNAYDVLGGNLKTVKSFIKNASKASHVEITSLIVPGINDSTSQMDEEARWIASVDPAIPLHINRYFPCYRYHEAATDISLLQELTGIAKRYLENVYVGNV